MPYGKREVDDKWEVINEDTKEVKGTHPSEKEADAQLAALYANADPSEEKIEKTEDETEPTEIQKAEGDSIPTFFIPITKIDAERREVWGWASIEEPDGANEIMDFASSRPFFQDWSNSAYKRSGGKSFGNVRAMHQPIAAGKLIDFRVDDKNKGVYAGARIVDDNEWKKVTEGVYTGYSVGGSYVRRWPDQSNPGLIRYTAKPTELSIVDSPCVKSATFDIVKADGALMKAEFHPTDGANVLVIDQEPDAGTDFEKDADHDAAEVEPADLAKANFDETKHPRDKGKFAAKSAGDTHAAFVSGTGQKLDRLQSHLENEGNSKGEKHWGHVGDQAYIAEELGNAHEFLTGEKSEPPTFNPKMSAADRHKELVAHNLKLVGKLKGINESRGKKGAADWSSVGDSGHFHGLVSNVHDFAHGEGEYADTGNYGKEEETEDLEKAAKKAFDDAPDSPEPISSMDAATPGKPALEIERMPDASTAMEIDPKNPPSQDELMAHAITKKDLEKEFDEFLSYMPKLVKEIVAAERDFEALQKQDADDERIRKIVTEVVAEVTPQLINAAFRKADFILAPAERRISVSYHKEN